VIKESQILEMKQKSYL